MSYIEKTNIAGEETIARFNFTKVEYFNPVKLILFPLTWFRRWCYEFGVTNKRVVFKHGFISRKATDLRLEAIETVGVSNGIIGRIFGYGNLTLTGRGSTPPITVPHLANIIEVKKAVEAAKDEFIINR
jgi:uncharacterized membrane protein YdbT with pleckstrin-like domain